MTIKPRFPRPKHALVATLAAVSLGGLLLTSPARADTWVGRVSGSLALAANWSGGAAPSSGDSFEFGASENRALTNDLAPSFVVAGITITADAAGNYTISGDSLTLAGNISTANKYGLAFDDAVTVSGACRISLSRSLGSSVTFVGALSGSGSLTQTAASDLAVTVGFSGDNSGFTGGFTQNNDRGNRTAFNSPASGSASAAWTFNRTVNGGVGLNNIAGHTIYFGSLSGGGWMRSNNPGVTTISVGALNADSTWSGELNNTGTGNGKTGVIALVKTGSGSFIMSGAGNYTGGTTISGGTLMATNPSALSSGDITVNGGTLASSVDLVGLGDITLAAGRLNLDSVLSGSATTTLAPGKNFTMTGGTWTLSIANADTHDRIASAGSGTFSITGGTLALTGAIDYGATYAILDNFRAGSVRNLSITGYDTANYTAKLGADGVLRFTPAGIPEPSAYTAGR